MNPKQLNIIFNTFILPHFNYCPLIWMFCSKQAHNLLQSSHRRALYAKTGLFGKTYQEILSASGISSTHSTNLKNIIIEVFKSLHHFNPEFMWKISKVKSSKYSLRCGKTLEIPCAKKNVGINSFQFRACLAWNELPIKIKEIENLQNFKAVIKSHKDPYILSMQTMQCSMNTTHVFHTVSSFSFLFFSYYFDYDFIFWRWRLGATECSPTLSFQLF